VLHAFKVAEVGDIDAVTQAGFEENRTLLNFNFFLVNHDLDHETPNDGLLGATKRNTKPECRISNKEFRMMKLSFFFPSAFDIRYSIFCGLLFNFYTAYEEVVA